MPESKNSSELRKLPGYKRRVTETRRSNKRAKLENNPVISPDHMSAQCRVRSPGAGDRVTLTHEDSYYSLETEYSAPVNYACEAGAGGAVQCVVCGHEAGHCYCSALQAWDWPQHDNSSNCSNTAAPAAGSNNNMTAATDSYIRQVKYFLLIG